MSEAKEPAQDAIARHAHEISEADDSAADEENRARAERELREKGPQPWAKTSSGDADSITES